MSPESPHQLRVLVAHEHEERLREVTRVVTDLGHEVTPRNMDIADVPQATANERPDVAIVIVGAQSERRALETIDTIVKAAFCPVIAVLDVQDRDFINEAARRGIFAYIADGKDADELQSAMDIVLRRFAEYHDLEGAFGRRAVTERAKGILMERHAVDERAAFDMLRDHARRTNQKVVIVAEEITSVHQLLPESSATIRSENPG